MKKLLHVITDSGIGGAGVLLMNLFRHLDRSRYSLVLVLPKGSQLAARARELGVRYVEQCVCADCSFSAKDIPTYLSLFRAERPDILHTHACLSARIAGLLCGIPCAVDTKHCAYALSPLASSMPIRLATRALDFSTHVRYIATAEAARDVLVAKGVCSRRIVTIPGGSEPVESISEQEKHEIRLSMGLECDDFVVGYAARLERGKGHESLIEAARQLADLPHIKFLIVGGGSLETMLQRSARDLPNVIFTGFRSDIGRVMNVFDLDVNCSYLSETSSLALSEGMSLGLPLVVTNCGGNSDMARGCGLVVPPLAPHALAAAIVRLADDPILYAALSHTAKLRFDTSYTARGMARETERVYERAMQRLPREHGAKRFHRVCAAIWGETP